MLKLARKLLERLSGRRVKPLQAVLFTAAFSSLALGGFLARTSDDPGAPRQERIGPDEISLGVPWTGEPGITESVSEIMAREAAARPKGEIPVSPPRESKPEFDFKTLPREQNPFALPLSRFPVSSERESIQAVEAVNAQSVGTSFLGARLSESGFIPPDSMGAVGPTQVLVVANGRIKVFDKSGVLGGLNVTTDLFFQSVRNGSSTSDPHIRYDRLSGRWFVTILNVSTPNRILIAVSSGSTITSASSFTFFFFQHDQVGATPNSDTGNFADYDTLGVDRFALYVGVNVFNPQGTLLLGTTGFVVNKTALLGGVLTVTAFRGLTSCTISSCTAGPLAPQGVDNDDPTATEGYFIGEDSLAFSRLDIRRITNPGGVPAISGNLVLNVHTTAFPILQVVNGSASNRRLDGLDDRLLAAAIHKNKITGEATLWTAHNIEANSNGGGQAGGGRNASRWYEIANLTTTPTLRQAGTLYDPAASSPRGFWMGTVAATGQGHMALASSFASVNDFAGVAVTGRLRTDPLGSLAPWTAAQTSGTAYNVQNVDGQRWGDYSQVTVDPTDDQTMWTLQEYCDATNSWGVRAIQLVAPPPATPVSANPPSVSAGQPAVSVTITGSSLAGSEFFDPGPDIGGPGFPKRLAASVSGGVTVNSVTFVDPVTVTLSLNTIGASAGAKDVTLTNPDGQTRTGTGILTIGAGPTPTPTNTPTPTPTGPTKTPTPTSTPTPVPASTTIFTNQVPATNTNTGGHELGTQFTSSQAGVIVALRFWKAPADSGIHTGRLWTDTGTPLASVVFSNETASGWQEQALSVPIVIAAGANYRVSYNVNTGFSYTSGGLSSPISNPPLTALSGCFYPTGGNFPVNLSTNEYFADARFQPSSVTATPTSTPTPGAGSIFTNQTPSTNTNTGGHEVGTRFTSSQNGMVVAIRFWKAPADSGTHTGRLWSDSGTLLASVVFSNETASGWQQQSLAVPVAIAAGVNYRVSYNVNTGFSYTSGGLSSPISNSPLTALSGCFYPTGGNFPVNLSSNNYFADIRFQ